ncbi:TPA: helix-turn-helix transcriptional regulator [Staphylococcus delphini]|uniref:Transcriptional regulator n=1 Tax=Staphylococcus lutrae TaxID=155085 RepID=A0AAC9RPA6_9STAP|nr:helix-turn-helix transcriptional regulator [Staphylococcus lutrae]HEC2151058.1 helix-turn-helix transcriptional regulator [Staphylococcus delphini]ARJ50961.1 transcriptional regulator [Staphylococcus lutrae]PNZ39277.1 XRE family transcriptional regulator [Staphylococcus lutrae]HEC2161363.1 helix-turn-helix transcriptional regulator [Staphylococcus delphini]HEC2169113.1 helix-turn-helix transcriptional regulator [Staphylococcus delphini]
MKNNFRIIIAKKKLKIADVHDATGISRNTLYGLYKETTKNPDTITIMKICHFLNVTPNDLLVVKEVNDHATTTKQ